MERVGRGPWFIRNLGVLALLVLAQHVLTAAFVCAFPAGQPALQWVVLIGLVLYAGWRTTHGGVGGLGMAALSGAAAFFLYHVGLKSLLMAYAWIVSAPWPDDAPMSLYALGVLVSFLMFAPVASLVAVLGAVSGRRRLVGSP
jgi:hypothetical protein